MVTGKGSASHYVWGDACDGWRLVDRLEMSVIHERIPPGAGERRHYHARARQFFLVLRGRLGVDLSGEDLTLGPEEGVEVAPNRPHRVFNASQEDVEFVVASCPGTSADRVEC